MVSRFLVRHAGSRPSRPFDSGWAEERSCYGDISAATGTPKSVYKNGYTHRDGTYVRSHSRSLPSNKGGVRDASRV